MFYFTSNRDCEELLSRVETEYEKPHKDLLKLKKNIKNTLEQHNNRLLAAKDLIQESAFNTNHTKNLLIPIQNNLNDFNVSYLCFSFLSVNWLCIT